MNRVTKQPNLIERTLKSTNLSQVQLAEKLGVSPAQISKWKKGDTIPDERKLELKGLMNEESVPQPLKNLFMEIKDNYLDDDEGLFADSFDETVETLVSQMEAIGVVIPWQYLEKSSSFETRDDSNENFANLVHDLLRNTQALEQWYEMFIMDMDAPGQLFELGEDIRQWFTHLAWKEVSPDTLEMLGIDTYQLSINLESVACYLRSDIYDYCQELNATNTAFKTDYHILLGKEPRAMAEAEIGRHQILRNLATSSAELLPYSTRVILDEIKSLQKALGTMES